MEGVLPEASQGHQGRERGCAITGPRLQELGLPSMPYGLPSAKRVGSAGQFTGKPCAQASQSLQRELPPPRPSKQVGLAEEELV